MAQGKKTTYIIVMVLGGTALLIDRIVGYADATGPAPARASEMVSPVARPIIPDAPVSDATPIPAVPFPPRVASVGRDAAVGDLFAAPRVIPADGPEVGDAHNSRPGAGSANIPGRTNRATFAARHHLQAVLNHARLQLVILDEHRLRVGEEMDGCMLIGVEGQTARFKCCDGEVMLIVITAHEGRDD